MAKKPVSKEGKQTFPVLSPIKHDGKDFKPGDDITVDFDTFQALSAANAVEGEWEAEAAPAA